MVKLTDLPGLGAESEQMLLDAGVDSVEILRRIGSVRAYLRSSVVAGER
ncbi:hypothetical protein HG263_03280 [Pseudoalteromonas sp. JBTF-M23]|uniref:TfoX C-terminal domain-containing protein n=1 Tax=Pseudoalteromonas caenipelagi TaxID=2726988 RepID=A0A849VC84_9GAMM|nr:TfoX/Sxy family DNA transformation protein [Pseudoalteromonas caenipelagi]NOU49564.1 hypothetical protein [Pseudoalteromonas caenipelagi]